MYVCLLCAFALEAVVVVVVVEVCVVVYWG
jgi:hypothetical protein